MGIGSFFNPILAGGGTVSSMDVDFIASTQSTEAGATISFTNLSDPTPIFNFWEFGDGDFSTASNPDKIYNISGTFSVTLNACDLTSGGIETKNNYITTITETFIEATGGDILEYELNGDFYRSHTFNSTGTFSVTQIGKGDNNEIDVVVVAGGGSGGSRCGGGGGAGGYKIDKIISSIGQFNIIIGSGGSSVSGSGIIGNNGNDSTAFDIVTIGGGGGGSRGTPNISGQDGGSGGGAMRNNPVREGGAGIQPNSISGGFGNKGGDSILNAGSAGGGGAGSPGVDNTASGGGDDVTSTNGGSGISNSLKDGNLIFYAGGGGGGNEESGSGGIGGGGDGANDNMIEAINGLINTGSGGGGGNELNRISGAGGSGIVIVGYKIKELT